MTATQAIPPDSLGGTPGFLYSKVARLAKDYRVWRVVIPSVLGVSTLLWTQPISSLIYGQDSLRFFIQPFNYNFASQIPYNYLFSSSVPLYDNAQNLYVEGIASALHFLGASDALTEHVLIIFATAVGVFGLIDLLETASKLVGKSVSVRALAVACVFYVVNPFMLTTVWWHFEAWSLLQVLSPFLISLCLHLAYSRRISPIRVLATVALCVVLAPGVTEAYAVSVVALFAYAMIYILFRGFTGNLSIRKVLGRVTVGLASAAGILAWSNIPLYQASQTYGLGLLTGAAGNSIPVEFVIQSRTTSLQHVWTLLGLSWIYTHPGAYGWTHWLPWLEVASLMCPLLLIASATYLSKQPAIRFLLPLTLIALFISVGNNPPGGPVNSALVNTGGIWSFLVNPYYFVGQYYVVFLGLVIYLVWRDLETRIITSYRALITATGGARDLKDSMRSPAIRRWHYAERARLQKLQRLESLAAPAICLALILASLSVMSAPFVTHKVYATSGRNIDQFNLPTSFYELKSYFDRGYAGANFFVLVLPLSSKGPPVDMIDGGSLVDSTELLPNFIPYPLFYTSTSPVALALDNILLSGAYSNLTLLLSALHVKFVVLDPFSNLSSSNMYTSPNGSVLNYSSLVSGLTQSLGLGTPVGDFVVYTVAGVVPIAYPVVRPTVLVAPRLSEYVGLLASVSEVPEATASALQLSSWSSVNPSYSQVDGGEIYALDAETQSAALDDRSVPMVIGDTGHINSWNVSGNSTGLPGVSWNPSSRVVTFSESQYASLGTASSNLTSVAIVNDSFYNSQGHSGTAGWWLAAPAPPILIHADIDVRELDVRNWVTLSISHGDLSIQLSLYNDSTTHASAIEATAYFDGNRYAWNNTPISGGAYAGNLTLDAWVNSTTFEIAVKSSTGSEHTLRDRLIYQGSGINRNAGSNLTAAPSAGFNFSAYSVTLFANQLEAVISDCSIASPPPYRYMIAWHGNASGGLLNQSLAGAADGDYLSSVQSAGVSAFDYVLNFPLVGYWQLSSNQGSVQKLSTVTGANVFLVRGPFGQNSTRLMLRFTGPYTDSTLLSVVELTGLATSLVILALFRRFHWSWMRVRRMFEH